MGTSGTVVGGDPTTIRQAARQLRTTCTSVASRPTGIDTAAHKAESACGDALHGALARFAAAYGQFVGDVAIEPR